MQCSSVQNDIAYGRLAFYSHLFFLFQCLQKLLHTLSTDGMPE